MTKKRSYFHRGGEIPLLGKTIPEHISQIVTRYPANEAIVSIPQKLRLNYSQFSKRIDELAKGLISMGFAKGDRIGVWSTNNLEWVLLQMATARIGAVQVNINPAYRLQELEHALKCSEVQCLFTIPSFRKTNYVEMLAELLPEIKTAHCDRLSVKKLPLLRRVVIYDPLNAGNQTRPYKGFTVWPEVIRSGAQVSDVDLAAISDSLDPDDLINIQYTSGTTGLPKAVMLTHHNILNNAWFSARAMHFNLHDKLCIPVPFYHCFGMVLGNLLCFSVGATAVIPCEHFDPEAVLAAIELEQCTAVHGVPTMFIAELDHPEFKNFHLESLRTGIMAGAPCPPTLMKRVMEDLHCREILIGYGETEASPLTHLTTRADSFKRRTETVGRNLPHQEVKIIDTADGHTVQTGEAGEICFRGYHVMQGYYGNPEATAEAVDPKGWLHSGDLGRMDQDGYMIITGRLKDLVIRGGENIYPREIEDVLFTHPEIAEVAVFGLPDDYYGEELAAWILLHPQSTCREEDIRSFCRNKLAHYKVPKYIQFVESFPMTVTGKLQKFRMRELALEALNKK